MMEISAFGDEIAVDFEEQLQGLRKLNIKSIDERQAWGVRCTQFTADHIQRIQSLCQAYEIKVVCMGSPIGKSPIQDPIQNEKETLMRLAEMAHQLGTKNIRLFSFYPRPNEENAVAIATERLGQLTDLAHKLDIILLLENEKHLVGDTPQPCYEILKAINSPRLRFLWDPANFVQCGIAHQVDEWWPTLHPYIAYIHIKDALLADGSVVPAGEGDGQVSQLLAALASSGYEGILSLEPHLAAAGQLDGFSGLDKMETAVTALRQLMRDNNISQ